ncbi:MAG TPA: hypothetical protein VGG75_37910 [Trebonia sp.]|jgi:hypothetical protein
MSYFADELGGYFAAARMRLSRLHYDKPHRCPTWAGPGWSYGDYEKCGASFASFMYKRRAWQWRFTRCPSCGVLCLPHVTRWADPAWLWWYLRDRRKLYGKWPYRNRKEKSMSDNGQSKPFADGDIIYANDIQDRIQFLASEDANGAGLSDDEARELEKLSTFLLAVIGTWGEDRWESMTFVADSYWANYAYDQSHDIYGAAVDTDFWGADMWADVLRNNYTAVELGDVKYWADGR